MARTPSGARVSNFVGVPRKPGATAEGAVVLNVSVAVTEPFAGIVTEAPELQLDSDGRPVHVGATVTAPLLVNPFCDVNVSVVEPDCPGAVTGTVVGFAEIVNVGVGVTV